MNSTMRVTSCSLSPSAACLRLCHIVQHRTSLCTWIAMTCSLQWLSHNLFIHSPTGSQIFSSFSLFPSELTSSYAGNILTCFLTDKWKSFFMACTQVPQLEFSGHRLWVGGERAGHSLGCAPRISPCRGGREAGLGRGTGGLKGSPHKGSAKTAMP